MDAFWKSILWSQFGAAIDSLAAAIKACPEELWGDRSRNPEFWYVAYHTLFFLDFYTSEAEHPDFRPPAPFTLAELDPAGLMPERVYTKDELLTYLAHGRAQAKARIQSLTEESARRRRTFLWIDLSEAELLLYNGLRHVQHHSAQLNLLLRQGGVEPPRWVKRGEGESAF